MYQLVNARHIKRLSDRAFIPIDPSNKDYRAYLTWLESGGVPEPAEVTPLPPVAQMEAIFRDLPVELRNLFANDRSMIKACLDLDPIDWELIEYRIQNIPVPTEHPELASLKTALLALIPERE